MTSTVFNNAVLTATANIMNPYTISTSGYMQTIEGSYMSNFERAYKVALKLVNEGLVKDADDLKTFNKLVELIENALSGK